MRFYTAHRQPGPPSLVVHSGPFLRRDSAEAMVADLAADGIAGAIVIAAADRDAAAARAARLLGLAGRAREGDETRPSSPASNIARRRLPAPEGSDTRVGEVARAGERDRAVRFLGCTPG